MLLMKKYWPESSKENSDKMHSRYFHDPSHGLLLSSAEQLTGHVSGRFWPITVMMTNTFSSGINTRMRQLVKDVL